MLTIAKVGELLGIGFHAACVAVRVGLRWLIPAPQLRELLDGAGAQPTAGNRDAGDRASPRAGI